MAGALFAVPALHVRGTLDAVLRIWGAQGRSSCLLAAPVLRLLLPGQHGRLAGARDRWGMVAARPPGWRDNACVRPRLPDRDDVLQNLLAADPSLRSPSWPQVPALNIRPRLGCPALPFRTPATVDAPQRSGAAGRQLAAEDDLLNNMGGMSVRGRDTSRRQASSIDFMISTLSADEFSRWRSHQFAFVRSLLSLRAAATSPSRRATWRACASGPVSGRQVCPSPFMEAVFRSNLLARELQRAFAQ